MSKTGIELIAEERNEQIIKHNKSVEDDVKKNGDRQLVKAVINLLMNRPMEVRFPKEWKKETVKKLCNKDYKERLITAGALCAAEYDRVVKQEELKEEVIQEIESDKQIALEKVEKRSEERRKEREEERKAKQLTENVTKRKQK